MYRSISLWVKLGLIKMWLFKRRVKEKFQNISMTLIPHDYKKVGSALINIIRVLLQTQIMELAWMIGKIHRMDLLFKYKEEKDQMMIRYDHIYEMEAPKQNIEKDDNKNKGPTYN